MQQTTQKKGFGWGYFFVGLLFLIAAVFAFVYPGASLEAITFIFAGLAVINGLWLIFSNLSSGLRVVAGILNVLLGIFMFANIYLAMTALPLIFAFWFIVNSVFELIYASAIRPLGEGFYWFTIVVNVIGVLVGIMLFFQPMVAALTLSFLVGLYLALIGVECIVLAFAHRHVTETVTKSVPLADDVIYRHREL